MLLCPPQCLIAAEWKKQLDSILFRKRSDEQGRCSDASFEGLPERLQEVIRGKYVLSSSSSFRPPLDQPASVWENWFSPSPPPLLSSSLLSSFFPSQVPFEACSSTLKSSSASQREKRKIVRPRQVVHTYSYPPTPHPNAATKGWSLISVFCRHTEACGGLNPFLSPLLILICLILSFLCFSFSISSSLCCSSTSLHTCILRSPSHLHPSSLLRAKSRINAPLIFLSMNISMDQTATCTALP